MLRPDPPAPRRARRPAGSRAAGPRAGLVAVAVAAILPLAACTEEGAVGEGPPTVAVLLADDTRPRWQARDLPALEARLAATCPDCVLEVQVADGDPDLQAEQLTEVVEEGADAVVLQATSATAGAALVAGAGEVPVVAYEGALTGAAHAVGTDGGALGRLQAAAVVDALGGARAARGARVLALGGPATSVEQARTAALREALRAARVRIVAPERAVADDPSAEAARAAVTAARRAGRVDAVVAASDVQAGAARAGLGRRATPVVGADADLEGVRRLVAGTQAASAWTDERAVARRAADVAAALARGEEVPSARTTADVAGVPTDLVAPVPVTLDEVARLLVRRRVVTVEEVCDAATLPDCRRAGLA